MAGKSDVEILAKKLTKQISDNLKIAYDYGYSDSSSYNCRPNRNDSEKRIGRVYLENGNIMIASNCRINTTVQKVSISNEVYLKELLISQINAMIEDAEERGRKEGSLSHTSI